MTKINVAIVDDNERMIGLLDAILKTDKNIEVIGRGDDGVKALDIIRNQEPDVVLLDLIMPKLDGLEVMHIGHWSGEYYGECIQSRCYVLYYEAF